MISIFTRTLIVYILLNVTIKLMGKRQIGELDVSELVSTLLISEIAAIPIDDPDLPLLNAVIPILFILSLEIIISHAKTKSNRLKKCLEGEPAFIVFQGRLIQKTLNENRISINEFLSEMRSQGIGNVKSVKYALLEQSGKISFLKDEKEIAVAHPVIIDGEPNQPELSLLGYSEADIAMEAEKRSYRLSDIFLMTIDDEKSVNIIIKEEK